MEQMKSGTAGRRLEETIDIVEIVKKYIVIEGMYELKNKTGFSPLDESLNPDS